MATVLARAGLAYTRAVDRLRRHPRAAALAGFLLLALALGSPRLLGASAYIVDDWRDVEIFFWDFWWLGEALRSGSDPWYTHAVFAPGGTALGYHPTGVLYALLSLPLQAGLGVERGVIAAYNLFTLASLTLAGWLAFLLARRLGSGDGPAFLAGVIYSFSSYHFWHLGRLHVGGIELLPLFMLALLGLVEGEGRPLRRGLALGGVAVLLLYSSLTNLASALLMAVAVGGVLLAVDRPALRRRGLHVGLAGAGVLTLVAATPFIHAWLAYPAPVAGARSLQENVGYSADLAGYLVPGRNSVLWGWLSQRLDPGGLTGGQEIFTGFLPWLLLPLALAGAKRAAARRWAALAAVFLLLSLGPWLKVAGAATSLPLPYRLLYEVVPLLKVSRSPVRLAAPFLLGLAMVAAFGARALADRAGAAAGRWRRAQPLIMPALLLLALAEGVHRVELAPRRPAPALYSSVAASDGLVVNVPLYHARVDRRLMYHQIFHRRPVTSACIPRATAAPHQAIEGTRLRACLLEPAGCGRADPRQVAAEVRDRGVGWVIVHDRNIDPSHADLIGRLLTAAGAERMDDPDGLTGYLF